MPAAAELFVEVSGKDVGVSALLARLQVEMRKTDETGLRLGQTLGPRMAGPMQQTADGALRAAQAQARLAVAMGEPEKAVHILTTALHENVGATEKVSAAVQTQVAHLEFGTTAFRTFGATVREEFISMIGPVALAGAAIGAVEKIGESFKEAFHFAAELNESREAFGGILGDFERGNTIITEANARGKAFGFTQEEITKAFKELGPIIRTSTSSTQEQTDALARMAVLHPEAPVQALTGAIEGIKVGRFRELSKELGLNADEQARLKHEVASGADAFTALNAVLDQHGVTLEVALGRMQGAAGAERRLAQAAEDLKIAEGALATSRVGINFVENESRVYTGLSRVLSGDLAPAFVAAQQEGDRFRASGSQGAGAAGGWARAVSQQTAAAREAQAAIKNLNSAIDQAREAAAGGISATTAAARADEQWAAIQADTRRESILLSEATQDGAIASQTAATQKELEATQTQLLAARNQDAANAFLSLNPNIDAAGIKAQVTAGAISPLIGRLAELILQLQGARAELAALGSTGAAAGVGARGAPTVNDKIAVSAAAEEAARQRQILALGTHAQKVALLRAEYERLAKQYGATSAQAIDAETKLRLETQKTTSGARAAGAAHLSDAAKLNNSLLAQDTHFANQEEDADAKHQKKLLDIEEEFQKKRQEAQKAFDQDKLDSRAGFYEQLGSVESHGLQVAMSQKFEAAAKEANEIAKTQGADAAQKFMEAARSAIEHEGKLQEEIDKAKKEGDKGKAEFLTGVLKLQQQAV